MYIPISHLRWHTACLTALAFRPRAHKCHIPSKECRHINYSSPDALGDSDIETRDKPACSTEEEGTMEEEGGSGGSDVALGQHSTAGRYQHYINIEQDLKKKEEEYICNPELLAVGVVCKSVQGRQSC